jgi:hypothetical protein
MKQHPIAYAAGVASTIKINRAQAADLPVRAGTAMRTHVPNGPLRNAKSSRQLILMLAAFFTTGVVAPVGRVDRLPSKFFREHTFVIGRWKGFEIELAWQCSHLTVPRHADWSPRPGPVPSHRGATRRCSAFLDGRSSDAHLSSPTALG